MRQTSMWFDGGMGIISDTTGITETHVIKVVAVDAAGNETEADPVRVWVVHKEEEEETAAVPYRARLWPIWLEEEPFYLPFVVGVGLLVGGAARADKRTSDPVRRKRR
jgi:hypothetical protein